LVARTFRGKVPINKRKKKKKKRKRQYYLVYGLVRSNPCAATTFLPQSPGCSAGFFSRGSLGGRGPRTLPPGPPRGAAPLKTPCKVFIPFPPTEYNLYPHGTARQAPPWRRSSRPALLPAGFGEENRVPGGAPVSREQTPATGNRVFYPPLFAAPQRWQFPPPPGGWAGQPTKQQEPKAWSPGLGRSARPQP